MADIFEDGFVDFSDSVYRDFSIRDITPFKSSVRTNYATDGSISNYVYTFSQAYVVTNSPADSRASGVISGMGNEFVIPEDEDIEFQVKVTLDKQNYKIIGTEFLTGEPSQEGENTGNFTHPVFDYKTEDSEGDFQLIYPVCSVRNGNLVNYTVRDNIYVDKTQLKQLGPTGAAENGTGGQVHLIVESGYTDPSLPIRFRGISGGSGIQVRYDVDNASGGNFIIIDSSGSAGGGGGGGPVWTGANTGDYGQPVYVDGTGPVASNKAAFRKLRSSDSSVGIQLADSNTTVDFTVDLQSTTDGGQSTTNKVGVGTDGTYVPSNYLEIYGTTKIQNRTTATDGTLQFGNQAASNITYSHTDSAIQFGENVNELQFIDGSAVGIGSSNSVSVGGIDNTTY